MSLRLKWVLVLGLMVSLMGAGAGPAAAAPPNNWPEPKVVITVQPGPGVCC